MISGLITLFAFVSFIGIAIWAWSRRNRERFDAAAQLPLDEESQQPASCRSKGGEL